MKVVIRALDHTHTRASNEADVGALDGVNTGGHNKVGMTMGPDSKDGVVAEVKSKVDSEVSYKLDSLILRITNLKNILLTTSLMSWQIFCMICHPLQ